MSLIDQFYSIFRNQTPAQQPYTVQQQQAEGASFTNVQLPTTPIPSPTAPTTIYVPGSAPGRGGERAQMELQNVKVTYDPVGGAYEAYRLPARSEPGFTRIYGVMPVSGGGSGALQSGMVSEKPLTPLIYTQPGKEFAPSARPEFAPMILSAPERFSRLGSEAYGGYVMPLDERRVTPGTLVSRYPAESGNLARLADPMGVNRPKSEWSELPWTIDFAKSPTFQAINKPAPTERLQPLAGQAFGGMMLTAPERMPLIGESGGTVEPGSYFQMGSKKMWVTTTGALALPITSKGELSLGTPSGTSEVQNLTGRPLPPAPLTFEGLEKTASEKVYSVLPKAMKPMFAWGGTQIEKIGLTPSDVTPSAMISRPESFMLKAAAVPVAGMVFGGMRGVAEKPITTGASLALGFGMGAAFKGMDVVGAKAATGAVEAYPRATSILTKLNVNILPTVLASVYGADVVSRSTGNMKYGTGKASLRFGEILTTETMPLVAGGYGGYKAVDIGLRRVPQLYTVPREAEIISGAKPEERAATKATLDIFKNIERVESPLKNAPDFTQVSGVRDLPGFGERVKGTEHSVFGRTTEIGQMPKEWIEARGMTKDVDIFVNKPSEFGKDLSRAYPKELVPKGAEDFTALTSKRTGQTAVDIHPFPERYPIGRGQEPPTGDYVKALIDPIPKRGGLLETKGITQEKLFVQTQRKATSILGEKIGEYGPPEHRMKDVADTLNYVSYLGEQTTGYRKARLQESFGVLKEYFQKPEVYGKYKGGSEYVDMISKMEFGKPSAPAKIPKASFLGREDMQFSKLPSSVPKSLLSISGVPSILSFRPSVMSRASQTPSTLSMRSISLKPSTSPTLSSELSYPTKSPSSYIRSPFKSFTPPSISPKPPTSFISSPPSKPSSPYPSITMVSFPSVSPSYKPISPVPPLFPGFGWGGGSDIPVRKSRLKSPFRETIGIKSMLAGVLKGMPKKKKGRKKKV